MIPAMEGWYWVRNLTRGKEMLMTEGIVEVCKYSTTEGLYACAGIREADLNDPRVSGEFKGPLVSPWEKKK